MYFLILICLKLNITILCFFLFPGCHAFQTRPQLSPVYLLRLVDRPAREFSRWICEKCQKFLHRQLKEICSKVRKWSGLNVPLFSNRPQQFPFSLKVISKYPLFPKSKCLCFLVPQNPWEALMTTSL